MNAWLLRIWVILLCASIAAGPAYAAWREASSEHFVVYANENESTLRSFAEKLERYHAAMAYLMSPKQKAISASNRVTVYVVDSQSTVQKLHNGKRSNVAGFYVPRAGGSVAIVSDIDWQSGANVSLSEQILLHEYAHHFMHSNFGTTFPRWFTEGFAEFYSTASFQKDGAVGLGLPNVMRGYDLATAVDVDIEDLLDSRAYVKNKTKYYDTFYAHSWLLFHYLMFDQDRRKGQLSKYIRALLSGVPEAEAARTVFGDLKLLNHEMNIYINKTRMRYFKITPDKINFKAVSVRELSAGHAAIMPIIIRSRRGVDAVQAAEVVAEARQIAARFPDDPRVLAALAEAEHDTDQNDAAIAAADKALAQDPKNMDALIQRALSYYSKAQAGTVTWDQARAQLIRANKLENDNPIPLIYYYRTYLEERRKPPEVAVDGLEWASQLAPQDTGLKLTVAQQMIVDKRFDVARALLTPLTTNPHDDDLAGKARHMLDSISEPVIAAPTAAQ